jgi:hypothetical protein
VASEGGEYEKQEKGLNVVKFTCKAKIIGAVKDETIKYSASIKADGTKRDAGEFRKVYASAIIDDDIAILRFDMRNWKETPAVKAGESVNVVFSVVSIENDISQINVIELTPVK